MNDSTTYSITHAIFLRGQYTNVGSAHFCALCSTVLRLTPKLMDVLNTYSGTMVKYVLVIS